jgi:hypothetical protein
MDLRDVDLSNRNTSLTDSAEHDPKGENLYGKRTANGSRARGEIGLAGPLCSQIIVPGRNPRRLCDSIDACSRSSASRDGRGAPALRADRHRLSAGTMQRCRCVTDDEAYSQILGHLARFADTGGD